LLTCATFARPEPRRELELIGDGWTLAYEDNLSILRLIEADKTTILRRLNSPPADHAAAFLTAVLANNPAALDTGDAETLPTLAVSHAALVSARENRSVDIADVSRRDVEP